MEIFITDLTDYVNGKLRGFWLDVEYTTEDEIWDSINAFLKEGGDDHEEWIVTDYNEFPPLGEHPTVADIVAVSDCMSDNPPEAVQAWITYSGIDALSDFEHAFKGVWDSEVEFATDLVNECYNLEKDLGSLAMYFDYEAFARDCFMGDYISIDCPTGVAVFSTNY